jgi:two-component system sensor histidine kinase TctE
MRLPLTARSLRVQISLWLLLPLMALLALDAYLTYERAMLAANTAFDRTLEASLKAMREGISLRDGRVDVEVPNLALELFDGHAGPHVYYLIRNEHGVVTGYDDLPPPARHADELYKTVFYDTDYCDQPLRMAAQWLPVHDVGSARIQLVQVLIGETIEPRQATAKEILLGSLVQELALVALALVIVWLGVPRGLRQLHRLSDTVSRRDGSQLDPIDERDLPTEMKPLVGALNQHVERLHRLIQARKRFFADAAHQLKTPLAIIQASSELALREPDGERVRQHMRDLHSTVDQASRTVQQLLSLSRIEPDSGYLPTLQPVRLDELAQSVALEWAPVARSRGVDLGFEGMQAVWLDGQPLLLEELIGNLIDNAIRYAGSGAVVTVRVSGEGGGEGAGSLLQVVDNGPGVEAGEREQVFKRFYRGTTGQGTDGSGLGLSIVREIARLHQAGVALTQTAGGGLTVSVCFASLHGGASVSRPSPRTP